MSSLISRPAQSLIALLDRIIDYAGLFPPASLSLKESVGNFSGYLSGPYKSMLSRFICPVKLLDDLSSLLNDNEHKINLSVLVTDKIEADCSAISGFLNRTPHNVNIDTVEVKVPDTMLEKPEVAKSFLNRIFGIVSSKCDSVRNIFFEIAMLQDWKSYLGSMISDIASTAANFADGDTSIRPPGFKLRTGSAEPSAIPRSEQIASVINTCLAHKLRLKFTAGLHHPFRNTDPEFGTVMHGFLNVFSAGILAYAVGMTDDELTHLLDDYTQEHFSFSDTELTWFEYTAPIRKIENARKDFITSFGSCSFDEPVNDLKSLNLLV